MAIGRDRRARGTTRRRLRLAGALCAAVAAALLAAAPAALADYGVNNFDVTFTNQDGSPDTQAGSHPYALTTQFNLNYTGEGEDAILDGDIRNLNIQEIAGLIGNASASALPRCSGVEFLDDRGGFPKCKADTAVGQVAISIFQPGGTVVVPVFNLQRPPGVVTRFGFDALNVEVTIDIGVKGTPEYNVIAPERNLPQIVQVFSAKFQLWGNPQGPAHDRFRGSECGREYAFGKLATEVEFAPSEDSCPSNAPKVAFLTLPTRCAGPQATYYESSSWQEPSRIVSGLSITHDNASPPNPIGFSGCGKLGFSPTISALPTTKAAQSPTGLDFSLDVKDEGLTNPEGLANSDIEKAAVTLPEGMSANPSIAEGLAVCSEAQLEQETVASAPGAGCPEASKIGTVEVETPLLDESIDGALYVAQPFDNPFHSLLALYIVIKNPNLGIIVKQAANVERNPQTGQLTTVVEDIPQLPFSHFRLHFREGTRSPLASPPLCGTHDATAELSPWSGTAPVTVAAPFQIISGPDSSPCPAGGTPPFHPGLQAGTINNAAGNYSPFYVRLTRNDGEQEITHFSIKLPPGVIGKLAGIPFCPDAAIAAATARTGPHGGQEELEHPSCPAASQVGHTLVGVGVGPSLAYAPGKVYLAGPYHGSALSIVAITAAKVGPFDLGTVVVREALKINPETAEVFVDATGSDPLPHIIQGIPVQLRDIRVYVDRPEFVLNPTSCERTSTASTVLGSGTNFASEADDQPVTVTSPFQAASCASLKFRPRLKLSLRGGTKRNDNPALRAVVTPHKGDANIGAARVTLPHSEFLDNAHIKTNCTRVQFNASGGNGEQCPKASIYGRARAVTPLLDEALSGPVYLRSSNHRLPDLVAALHSGEIDIDLDGRIDSGKGGRIRTTFEAAPDAPVTKFTLEMFGGKKGLLVNSTNLCKGTHRAIAEFTGQNGKRHNFRPKLHARCGGKGEHKKHGGKTHDGSSAARLLDVSW